MVREMGCALICSQSADIYRDIPAQRMRRQLRHAQPGQDHEATLVDDQVLEVPTDGMSVAGVVVLGDERIDERLL